MLAYWHDDLSQLFADLKDFKKSSTRTHESSSGSEADGILPPLKRYKPGFVSLQNQAHQQQHAWTRREEREEQEEGGASEHAVSWACAPKELPGLAGLWDCVQTPVLGRYTQVISGQRRGEDTGGKQCKLDILRHTFLLCF